MERQVRVPWLFICPFVGHGPWPLGIYMGQSTYQGGKPHETSRQLQPAAHPVPGKPGAVPCADLCGLRSPVQSRRLYRRYSPSKRPLPVYCVDTDEKKVAISFDAAWGEEKTDEILSILEERNIKSTFFLVGYWVDKYPERVQQIYEAGHEIGNHSTTHPHMS